MVDSMKHRSHSHSFSLTKGLGELLHSFISLSQKQQCVSFFLPLFPPQLHKNICSGNKATQGKVNRNWTLILKPIVAWFMVKSSLDDTKCKWQCGVMWWDNIWRNRILLDAPASTSYFIRWWRRLKESC